MKSWKTIIVGAVLATIVAIQPIIKLGVIDWKRVALLAIIATWVAAIAAVIEVFFTLKK